MLIRSLIFFKKISHIFIVFNKISFVGQKCKGFHIKLIKINISKISCYFQGYTSCKCYSSFIFEGLLCYIQRRELSYQANQDSDIASIILETPSSCVVIKVRAFISNQPERRLITPQKSFLLCSLSTTTTSKLLSPFSSSRQDRCRNVKEDKKKKIILIRSLPLLVLRYS